MALFLPMQYKGSTPDGVPCLARSASSQLMPYFRYEYPKKIFAVHLTADIIANTGHIAIDNTARAQQRRISAFR